MVDLTHNAIFWQAELLLGDCCPHVDLPAYTVILATL